MAEEIDFLRWLRQNPAEAGRRCGFDRLTDGVHGQWLRRMLDGTGDFTLQAHRGSYKSTCLSVAIAVLMLTEPEKKLLFLRKTDRDVTEMVRQVRGLLEHPFLAEGAAAAYGGPVSVKGNACELTLSCHLSPSGAVQLRGQGIGASLTGKHADCIFTDDIVNLLDRASAMERRHTRDVYQELQNIRKPGGRIINTGTPWHRDDAFALMPEPEKWPWDRTGLISAEQADRLRAAMSPSLFAANYELRHIAQEEALFPTEPPLFDESRRLWDGIAHLDAAYGGGDYTALTCARMDGDEVLLWGRLYPGHVNDHLEEIIAACAELRCGPVHLETNGDRGYLAAELRRRGVAVRAYNEHMNKRIKIAVWLRQCWPQVRFLRSGDRAYLDQILAYTEDAEHDDAPDSAACACRILGRHTARL